MSLVRLPRMRPSRYQPRPHRDHPDTIFNERLYCLTGPTFLEFLLKRFRSVRRSHIGNMVCPSVSHGAAPGRRTGPIHLFIVRSRIQRTDVGFCRSVDPRANRRRTNLPNALASHRPLLELQRRTLAPWLLYACNRYTRTSTPLLQLNKLSRELHISEAVPRHVPLAYTPVMNCAPSPFKIKTIRQSEARQSDGPTAGAHTASVNARHLQIQTRCLGMRVDDIAAGQTKPAGWFQEQYSGIWASHNRLGNDGKRMIISCKETCSRVPGVPLSHTDLRRPLKTAQRDE